MRIEFICIQCHRSSSHRSVMVEVEDDGVYVTECEVGHRTVHALTNSKFEILFELGLLALGDGYTREAVTSLAAAVEEFYRLYIKMILYKRAFHGTAKRDTLKQFWRRVSLSERQLGVFALAHLLEEGVAPSFPTDQLTKFRNDVIHAGRIPKFAEVTNYGQKIVEFVVPIYLRHQNNAEMGIAASMDGVESRKSVRKPRVPSIEATYRPSCSWPTKDLLGLHPPLSKRKQKVSCEAPPPNFCLQLSSGRTLARG